MMYAKIVLRNCVDAIHYCFYYLRKPSKAFEAKDVTDHEVESIEQLPVSRIIHNGFTSTRGIIN